MIGEEQDFVLYSRPSFQGSQVAYTATIDEVQSPIKVFMPGTRSMRIPSEGQSFSDDGLITVEVTVSKTDALGNFVAEKIYVLHVTRFVNTFNHMSFRDLNKEVNIPPVDYITSPYMHGKPLCFPALFW